MGEGVLIGDGRCWVRLTKSGPANELGYPTIIDARAGPFQGAVLDETVGVEPFRTQLIALHKTLKGEAKLSSYEGLEVVLVGNGRGGIGVHVQIVADHVAPIRLKFSFGIDQSYLPAVIQQIDAEFPPPYRVEIAP
ncbi:WapI family immunity protein [Bradyrhizobium tropiciagri]|uniref:WapI family immunity protein n=1 Tax=Bradyrhizobium tropiciagri TaxID=312253 RepID=UPI001BA6CA56|nr:hypothetical protein [Bradyrhizobium tropiciagri]